MAPLESAPVSAAESTMIVPRARDLDLRLSLGATSWPPVPAAALVLQQSWLPKPEARFQTGTVWLAATEDAFLVFAELTARETRTAAAADHERLWECGDVFEIFLQSFGGEAYFEFQIAPNGRRLQLHYPWMGVSRDGGLEPFIRRDSLFETQMACSAEAARWRVAAHIPVAPLRPSHPPGFGHEWRMAFCRYDYAADGRFCLSSTAPLTRPNFHRIGEWGRVVVTDGFGPQPAAAALS